MPRGFVWSILEPFARNGRIEAVTYTVLRRVSDETRQWYFKTGGIYLTAASRAPYFHWKGPQAAVLDNQQLEDNPDEPIPDRELEAIIEAGSALRTSLSDDIGTKRLTRI